MGYVILILLIICVGSFTIGIVKHSKEGKPTKRQLAYARDLGLKVPSWASKRDVSKLISKALDNGAKVSPERLEQKIQAMTADFLTVGWNKWDPSVHRAEGQTKRYNTANSSEYMQIKQYNVNSCVTKIMGESGRFYLVHENGCSCPDFRKRQLPCKHMYYTASALPKYFEAVENEPTEIEAEDKVFSGLTFIVIGRKQEPVKQYIEARGGLIYKSASLSTLEEITAAVISDSVITKRVQDIKERNIPVITFDELKKIFPIYSYSS